MGVANRRIIVLMVEDDWYKQQYPIGFFTSEDKANEFMTKMKKDKHKRWKNCRLYTRECEIDPKFEELL